MLTALISVLALGFLLGMRHATDPDHVIAVSTILARQRTALGAAAIGAAWGVGHTLTILVVGGGIILFGWVIPPRLGLSTELGVGVMLIVLGAMNLIGARRAIRESAAESRLDTPDGCASDDRPDLADDEVRGREHAPPYVHSHGNFEHVDAHAHGQAHEHLHLHGSVSHPHAPGDTPIHWLDRQLGTVRAYRLLRPLLVGVVHGLAGSAALALLALATIRSPGWGILYLLLFGLGTIVGMMLMTAALVVPFAYAGGRSARMGHGLRIASGLVSVAFGCFIAYRIGIVDGLFTGDPRWTPH